MKQNKKSTGFKTNKDQPKANCNQPTKDNTLKVVREMMGEMLTDEEREYLD